MKILEEYLGGMSFTKEAIRKYKHTIQDGEHKGKVFYSETVTPKINDYEWGKSKTIYYTEDSKEYKTIKGLLNNI
uniref:Uncharacterized protein n=1 Tax=uncultured marine virus TaxID=186617 RepID=A0A0F7L7X3_9VIRU|nr:hypothetical protein [uncultured marine virus]